MDDLDFRKLIKPVPRTAVFEMADWFVWGGSMVRTDDGLCHLLFARWPKSEGFQGWVTHSEIARATADQPCGPYTFQDVPFPGAGGDAWDADVTHNPNAIRVGDKFYLYYMGTKAGPAGENGWWDFRNRQRIGAAVADHPSGPWHRLDRPALDVTPGAWDCLMTSNPSVAAGSDGTFVMTYKGVGAGPMPKGGDVLCGVAFAADPLGPFTKHPEPIITNPEHGWAVEDSYTWRQGDRFYCLIKDFQGYFTHAGKGCLALFESADGKEWQPAAHPLAAPKRIEWDDGPAQEMDNLERPQLYLEGGKPRVLFCACRPKRDEDRTFNVHVPLDG